MCIMDFTLSSFHSKTNIQYNVPLYVSLYIDIEGYFGSTESQAALSSISCWRRRKKLKKKESN